MKKGISMIPAFRVEKSQALYKKKNNKVLINSLCLPWLQNPEKKPTKIQ